MYTKNYNNAECQCLWCLLGFTYFFLNVVCSLGIEPTIFCAADAMLYHWATQEHSMTFVIMHWNIYLTLWKNK